MNNIIKQTIKKFISDLCQSEGIDPNDWTLDLDNIHTVYVQEDSEQQAWRYWEHVLYQHKIRDNVTGRIWTMTYSWNYDGSIFGCNDSEPILGDLKCKIPIRNKFQPEFNNQPEFSFQ